MRRNFRGEIESVSEEKERALVAQVRRVRSLQHEVIANTPSL